MQAGLGRHATALWMSALMLAAMMSVPLLMSRSSGRTTMLASAATLIVTISAMNSVPAYLNGSAHGIAVAVLMIATGAGMLLYRLRANVESRHDMSRGTKHDSESIKVATHSSGTALLALLAGLSSGGLARFQLFAICGVSGVQPFWQIALTLAAVCALAFIADRSRGNRMLTALYVTRAVLIGALAANDNPALAPLVAAVFLVLDCLTIPALVNLRGDSASVLSAMLPRRRASRRHGGRRGIVDHTLLFRRWIRRAVRVKRDGERDLRRVISNALACKATLPPAPQSISPSDEPFRLAPRPLNPNGDEPP
jgi:cytochrome c biogenesis factor